MTPYFEWNSLTANDIKEIFDNAQVYQNILESDILVPAVVVDLPLLIRLGSIDGISTNIWHDDIGAFVEVNLGELLTSFGYPLQPSQFRTTNE